MAGIAISCIRASRLRSEGLAGAAVRLLGIMIVPSLILAFSNIDYWQVGLAASIILGTLQWLFPQGRAVVPSEPLKFSSLAVVIPIAILICIKAAMAVASTPYDGDSITYHLPMAVAFIQHHTALHQVMYHPGNSELLDSIGLASLGAVGGQSLMEGVVAFSFFLTAYGFARNLRAPQIVCLAAASAVLSMPIVADQLLTGENDVLVATLLLALAALWQSSPSLAAVALGLLAGTKFTGALEGVALIAILWPRRNKALSWKHLFIAVSIATPWYVRNWIETGNPVFLGAQTAGFTSTLAAHFLSAGPYIFSAFRNYMGLLAILGVIAIVPLARDKKLQATLAPIVPGLLLLMAAVWLITPNVAETTHGTLDQIRSGWSIRYVIIAGAFLTTGSIIWITRLSPPLAIAVALIAVIAASLRELKSSTSLDPSVSNFLLPCFAIMALSVVAFQLRSKTWRAMLLASASIVFAVTSVAGSARIKASWSERYEGHKVLGNFAFGPALAQASIQNARETATIGKIQALPIVGPSFERFDIIDKSGLSDAHWWQSVRREQPQAIIASNMARDNSVSSKELRVRESGLYKLVFDKQGVRIYVPFAT